MTGVDQPERIFQKRFYATAGAGGCVLLAVAWLFVKGVLTPRGFAAAAMIYFVATFAVFYLLIKSLQRSKGDFRREQIAKGIPAETIDRERYVKGIRSLKWVIAVFAVSLVYGFFVTQGSPPLARVAGAGFDVFILFACIHSLVRMQRKLKALSEEDKKPFTD